MESRHTVQLTASPPGIQVARLAEPDRPRVAGEGTDWKLHLRSVEVYRLRRREPEGHVPLASREGEFGGGDLQRRARFRLHLLAAVIHRDDPRPGGRPRRGDPLARHGEVDGIKQCLPGVHTHGDTVGSERKMIPAAILNDGLEMGWRLGGPRKGLGGACIKHV